MTKRKIYNSISLICLCLTILSCKNHKPEIKLVSKVDIETINEFSDIASIKINNQENIIVYSLSRNNLKYKLLNTSNKKNNTQYKEVKLSEGFRFLGFADKYMLTYDNSYLQIINLENNSITYQLADFPYGNYSKSSMRKVNSNKPTYYANYRNKSIKKRRSDCTNSEYADFLRETLKNDFLVKIDFTKDTLSIDTLLTGLIHEKVLPENTFGNTKLGVEDFQDSLCLFSKYSDNLFFLNKENKQISRFKVNSNLKQIYLDPVGFDIMENDYATFVDCLSKDNLRYANINKVIADFTNNLMHIIIVHDKLNEHRDFSILTYKNGEKIIEKEFDGKQFDFGNTFIFKGQLYIKNRNNEKDGTYSYNTYNFAI